MLLPFPAAHAQAERPVSQAPQRRTPPIDREVHPHIGAGVPSLRDFHGSTDAPRLNRHQETRSAFADQDRNPYHSGSPPPPHPTYYSHRATTSAGSGRRLRPSRHEPVRSASRGSPSPAWPLTASAPP